MREQVNSCITSLSLEWNNIGTYEQGIQRLADGLEVNGCLTSLVLCNNHINAQVPTVPLSCISVSLFASPIGCVYVPSLTHMLHTVEQGVCFVCFKAHVFLNLGQLNPSLLLSQGASCLARALRANSTLKDLDLRWNDVGNDGARAIRGSLDTNHSLTSVKLSGNKVGVEVGVFIWTIRSN